jgi:ABC-type transport system involved in multi-copper enzyme maturation permease subunit
MPGSAAVLLVAGREIKLLRRGRALRGMLLLLAAVAWLPPLLLPLRAGVLGLAPFRESVLLTLALGAVILPLLGLLAGADMVAGEAEDGTLVPLVTLPVSRAALFLGKLLGRGLVLAGTYALAFVSAASTIALASGPAGARDHLAVTTAGLLLLLACTGIGAALGTSGRGRVRAFGAALGAWLVLVFALDAVLLSIVVALAPPPPAAVGTHGHGELAAPRELPIHDPAHHAGSAEAEAPPAAAGSAWIMAADPVDLFRLSALVGGPGLAARLAIGLPAAGHVAWPPLVTGWLLWLGLPPVAGLLRLRRTVLR